MLEMYQIKTGNYSLEGKTYTSYGIQCDDLVIEDISLDRTVIEALVEQCNREELDRIHLLDVVEDFLGMFNLSNWQAIV